MSDVFYTSLLGKTLCCSKGNRHTIVGVWKSAEKDGDGITCMYVSQYYGETFLVHLPDPSWTIDLNSLDEKENHE